MPYVPKQNNIFIFSGSFSVRTQKALGGVRKPSPIYDVKAQVSQLQVAWMFIMMEQDQELHALCQLDPAALVVVHSNSHALPRHWSLLIDGKRIPPFTFQNYSVQRECDHDVTRVARDRGDCELVKVVSQTVFNTIFGGSPH